MIFDVEDNLKDNMRLYLAILNPETKLYHYEPLLLDTDNDYYYLVVGTSMTYYVGRMDILLVGLEPEYVLDDNITLDVSNTVYVSKKFSKIVVLDNFLSDAAMEVSMPNIDYILDNLVVLHNNVTELAIQTAEDATTCADVKESVEAIKAQCDTVLEECQAVLEQCQAVFNRYETNMSNMQSTYNNYMLNMRNAYLAYMESI